MLYYANKKEIVNNGNNNNNNNVKNLRKNLHPPFYSTSPYN